MTEVVITLEDDGSQWLPYPAADPKVGCAVGHHRIGTFSIPDELVIEFDKTIFAVMSQVIVIRCEHNWSRGCFEYEAYSSHFRPCNMAEIPPKYMVIMHKDDVGRTDSFKFEEMKPVHGNVYSDPKCIFNYCPHPQKCQLNGCVNKNTSVKE